MPQPSREDFNAAAAKVAQSAPPGLSREDFYKRVDAELSGGQREPLLAHTGVRPAGGYTVSDTDAPPSEAMQSLAASAHPTSLRDILPLLIPSGIRVAGDAAEFGARGLKQGISEASNLRQIPLKVTKALYQDAMDTNAGAAGRKLTSSPIFDRYMPNTSAARDLAPMEPMASHASTLPQELPPARPQLPMFAQSMKDGHGAAYGLDPMGLKHQELLKALLEQSARPPMGTLPR